MKNEYLKLVKELNRQKHLIEEMENSSKVILDEDIKGIFQKAIAILKAPFKKANFYNELDRLKAENEELRERIKELLATLGEFLDQYREKGLSTGQSALTPDDFELE